MSDVFWQALIAGIVTLVLAYMQMRTKQAVVSTASDAKIEVVKVAEKAEQVKTTLEVSTKKTDAALIGLARVAKDTHTLVNSNMGIQLKLHAATSKRLALISKDPDDIAAAELAELLFQEHNKKQAIVDSSYRKETI